MDAATIGAWLTGVGGICISLGTVIGVFLKARTDDYVKRKKAEADAEKILKGQSHEECLADDDRADRAYKMVIAKLEKRVATLEMGLDAERKETMLCREKYARLEAEVQYLKRKLEGRTG